MSQSFSNNIKSLLNTTVTNNFSIANERLQILTWLTPLEPTVRHQGIRDSRVENVGERLLQTEEYRGWYTGVMGGESDNAACLATVIRESARLTLGRKGEARATEEKGQVPTTPRC